MQTPNKPKQTRRKFDQEFKTQALQMVCQGQSACAVARSPNLSQKLIYCWKNQQKNQLGQEKARRTDELDRLKAQLKRVEMERDILKNHRTGGPVIIFGQPT